MNSAALQIIHSDDRHIGIPDDAKSSYRKILSLFSNSPFESPQWTISLKASGESGKLHFPLNYTLLETDILKLTIVNMLTTGITLATCSARIHDACFIFDYLRENEIRIEYINQVVFDNFYSYLGDAGLEVWHRNRYLQAMQSITETCQTFNILQIPSTLCMSRRWKMPNEPKRAPEVSVIAQLDRIFFDESQEIPLAHRVMYMTLRLRTHRISEVIAMPLDCISYPGENVFTITVPTSKETAYHIPCFHTYSFLLNGVCEGIYYKYLIQQHNYAVSIQKSLKLEYKGYLFAHPTHRRIMTTNDFNNFLYNFCHDNHITDSDGNIAKITSHDFRHINVCERLQGNIISAEETMVECNHSSLTQTLGYGYPAKKDETKHLAEITKQIPVLGEQKKSKCLQMPSFKYDQLVNDPATRIIPGYGICRNLRCEPQFEKCLRCNDFTPSVEYKDYFLAAINLLLQRNNMIAKKNGDPAAIQRNIQTIHLYQAHINRIDDIVNDTKEAKTS